MRQTAVRALEIRDEADLIRGLTRGELEARILDADRAQATAPPDISRQLRLAAQAEADTWQQAADAATQYDQGHAMNAQALASQLAAEREQLEVANTRYEQWSTATTSIRETATEARTELERRGLSQQQARQHQPEPGNERTTNAGWWQQFEEDLAATEHALEREHQAASVAGHPRPPQRTPQIKQEPQASAAIDPEPAGPVAQLDELLSRAAEAIERLGVESAEQEARTQYAARIDQEAQAEQEPLIKAPASGEAEIEM